MRLQLKSSHSEEVFVRLYKYLYRLLVIHLGQMEMIGCNCATISCVTPLQL